MTSKDYATPNLTVLVVEDDPVSAKLMQRMLENLGAHTRFACSAEQALEINDEEPSKIIVSDWMMPGMDGVELCRRIRLKGGSYVYFVLCSSRDDPADRVAAFEAGVDDFLAKPVDKDELRSRLIVAMRILSAETSVLQKSLQLEIAAQSLQEMNDNLAFASRRFEELFSGLPLPCFTFDQEGLVHEWNRAAEEAFGIPAFEAIMRPIWEVLSSKSTGPWSKKRIATLFNHGTASKIDWGFKLHGTKMRNFASHIISLRSPSGQVIGSICTSIDVTERNKAQRQIEMYSEKLQQQKQAVEQLNVQLNHLAVTDSLTGLWNRRKMMENLEYAFLQGTRSGKPISLLMMDIDFFKSFNDTFGHQVGDEVLKQFSEILKTVARRNEMPARYGGEEFAVVLQNCDSKGSLCAAQRFLNAVAVKGWPHRKVTISIGAATCLGGSGSIMQIVREADEALYFSKQTGRNRVTLFDSIPKTAAA